MNESHLIHKGPCSVCGSSDANARYSDGHANCFSCGAYTRGNGSAPPTTHTQRVSGLITDVEIRGLRARQITDATCQHFGYGFGKYKGKDVHVAPYYDRAGNLIAQHLRTKDKEFPWLGTPKEAMPFGFHASSKSGKMLVLTEGEIDALSFSQVQGNKWPVWSIGSGAGPQIKKYIADRRDLFTQFEKVVLMFDNDQPGRDAAQAAAEVLGTRAHIAELPLKDASDMLVAGRVEELITAMWRAAPYRPDGIVVLEDIIEELRKGIERGKDFALPSLTNLLFGRRDGEVWVVGAGTGAGKTDFLVQEMAHAVTAYNEPVGLFFLEATPKEIALRLAGKIMGKTFHVPDGSWSQDELEAAIQTLATSGKVFLYDSYGITDWEIVKERIRFLHHAHGVKYFVVDNLTSFATAADDERRMLELVMAESAGLAQEMQAFMWIVSHLATPEGKPHESGGQIHLRHLKGSRGIAAWAHGALGLERDQQAEDEDERLTTTVRFLKDRATGRATGQTFRVRYDFTTGLLTERDHGFVDETDEVATGTDF